MKIVLSGVETNNKGAELMLYAILQEIERRFPSSTIYINSDKVKQGEGYIQTSLPIVIIKPRIIYTLLRKLHLLELLKRIRIKVTPHTSAFVKGADCFLDGSGLHFCDQFSHNATRNSFWEKTLRCQKEDGALIVFLPQGFGPLEKKGTKESIKAVSMYADLIFAREQKSFDYLSSSGLVNMNKVKICTDFTCLVKGVFPPKYEQLKKAVCIIPNKRMLSRGNLTKYDYFMFLSSIVNHVKEKGHNVFLLNHEGTGDLQLIQEFQRFIEMDIEAVTGLNALETKGIISSSYLVVSSRFHGVASALNACVPCLSTSWSHKYAYLYKDYDMEECVLNVRDINDDIQRIDNYLDNEINITIREHLRLIQPKIQKMTKDMWNEIWTLNN